MEPELLDLIKAALNVRAFYLEQMEAGFHVCPSETTVVCTTRIWCIGDEYGAGPYVTMSHIANYTWNMRLFGAGGDLLLGPENKVWN